MGSAEGKNKEGRKLIKTYQKKHRNLTESKDSRHMRRLFNLYGGKKGYLDEREAKLFIKDVLFVCEMTDIPDVNSTVNAIFKELDSTNTNQVHYSELLKPSWGKVQDLLNTVYGKVNKINNITCSNSESSVNSSSAPAFVGERKNSDSSLSNSEFERNCPPSFECPITNEIMTDPVILVASGKTYERKDIEEWLKLHNTDPLTNEVLASKEILSVLALKNAIEEWKESVKNRQKEKREKKEKVKTLSDVSNDCEKFDLEKKLEKSEKLDKLEESEKLEKSEKAEKSEKLGKSEKLEKSELEKSEKTEKSEKVEKTVEKSEKVEKSNKNSEEEKS